MDAVILLFIYTGVSIIIVFLFWLFYRNVTKAALVTFFLMSCNFFFGSVYDFLKEHFSHAFISKFSFILPALLLLILILIVYFKRSNRSFYRTAKYLNLLLLLLITIDAGTLVFRLTDSKGPAVSELSGRLTNCDTCAKPDIYLIIVDEYAGKTELKDLFAFDNSGFENELQSRGFHIIENSTSNYNQTIYSMASLFNMDYIHHLSKPALMNYPDILKCRELIADNNLVACLKKNQYSINNYSFFDLAEKKKVVQNIFRTNRALLTHQTLIERFIYSFGARIASKNKLITFMKTELSDNKKIESLTRQVVFSKDPQPKFVYAHFNLPHWPYFFTSTGTEIPVEKLTEEFKMDKKAYIGYLQYANEKLLALVDFIRKNSPRPPVIMLLGDHGYRQLNDDVDEKYHFMNLNAVYFPDENYTAFYDGMTNVNQFRVTLNSLFGQKLPLLKDSTSFLKE
jgi:hypothetical protein